MKVINSLTILILAAHAQQLQTINSNHYRLGLWDQHYVMQTVFYSKCSFSDLKNIFYGVNVRWRILPSLRDSWIMHKKVYIGSICSPHISRDWFHKAGLPLAVLIKTWPKQEIKHMWLPNTLTLGQKSLLVPILGDPVAVSRGGEKSKQARKKFGLRKARIFFSPV